MIERWTGGGEKGHGGHLGGGGITGQVTFAPGLEGGPEFVSRGLQSPFFSGFLDRYARFS